jgi:two-component system, chemotaxis family, chemotaxis protein CheY
VKKVLIVDDSETVRTQVGRALVDAGFEVVGAGDGVEGLQRAQQSAFALVLLDINMPRMGGLELLEKLKQGAETKHVPVLVLTTEVQESMIDRAKKAGAAGWIVKPVKMDLLVAAVSKVAA